MKIDTMSGAMAFPDCSALHSGLSEEQLIFTALYFEDGYILSYDQISSFLRIRQLT